MKVGLISDIHASPRPLRKALDLFAHEGIDTILCAGDIAGYGNGLEECVVLLKDCGCRTVAGNHDLWWLARGGDEATSSVADYLRGLPRVIELHATGKKLHMVHASPPSSLMHGMRLLNENGEVIPAAKQNWREALRVFPFDVLVVGHTHQAFVEQLGNVLVINPGSTLLNRTCAILTLPGMTVQIMPLPGETALLSWNWSLGFPVVEAD